MCFDDCTQFPWRKHSVSKRLDCTDYVVYDVTMSYGWLNSGNEANEPIDESNQLAFCSELDDGLGCLDDSNDSMRNCCT